MEQGIGGYMTRAAASLSDEVRFADAGPNYNGGMGTETRIGTG